MLDTLFGLIPAASRGQQWLAEDLQLVNWGGYDGYHRVRFSPTATLLCGSSGSGKSTLMDAYIALMMPHTTPFNGASNGGVQGRPRGVDQRNIVSYGRGKLDESRTAQGTKVRVLRGDGTDTWTAVAMTWADHDGSRFTAVRAWYLPATARALEDTVRVRATIDGGFDLRELERAATQRLNDASVRSGGLTTFGTEREFAAKLHSTLGIGAAGAGSKAMSLLARIQAGQQITTVDELYKRMVLEEPETLQAADAVVEHFDELESTRQRMITAQQQVRTLAPIRGLKVKIESAAERLRLIDELGRFDDPRSLASLWQAERRLGLLREVEQELRDQKLRADELVRNKEALARAAAAERDGLSEVLRASGGDRLETAQRELRDAENNLQTVLDNRAKLDEALGALGTEITSAKQFGELVATATSQLSNPDAKNAALTSYAEAEATRRSAEAKLTGLESERSQAGLRNGNIPAGLDTSRNLLAEAAGLSPDELPFVGELIEVRPEFEPWREAFNLALGGFATTLLIDRSKLRDFRTAINTVQTPKRLRYEGVETGQDFGGQLDARTLPGRLDYRTGPFAGWLRAKLSDRFGFVCVGSADELSRHAMALTINGQTSQGARGAHGGHGRANVLGFSNQRRVTQLSGQIDVARQDLVMAIDAVDEAKRALGRLDDVQQAYRIVRGFSWDQIDVARAQAEQQRWSGVLEDLTQGNPKIAELRAQIAKAGEKVNRCQQEIGRARTKQEQVQTQWAEITDEVDQAQAMLDDAEDAGRALSEAQSHYLDQSFDLTEGAAAGSHKARLTRFDAALTTAASKLSSDQETAQQSLADQRETLRRTLTSFVERWPNPNLLVDPDTSINDFEQILTDLESSGLHTLERDWRNSLLKLSGNDLTNLDSILSRSLREIRERIEPINLIMQDLPFYDDNHRLQITVRETGSNLRQQFRRELRAVRELIAAAETDEQREACFARMAKLINRIRRQAPDFADLIDVRNHVRVSAERVNATTKEHVALYDHIGEKSGGESQELVAFIVGAALRYQLGDAGSSRPRYAPVFLDEALIKADAHFTERAIGAWRGLGFQLIIGAPNDKYSAIEPHVDVEYDILKDTHGRSWAKPKVALPA
ncbi:SbcC/MukB-like Walker B domain-containing protein [Propionimicrobium sp. PCR01-08-3]|uniref:ATP-binding protein n=1 Tax=Propionimicrobium sp. PCR01-08-3 TaxID=3052086 RepID=UPI00255C5990|nr:SbcC/MukB-like Walker B domain-containing protein [Propionimicrobium sp. PCR01-08-3]WIY84202.1 ATP-binding protein [Propionimicrobium sp. PCR01-08-3]